jgi:sn1-specific diacylglycerol lipase
MIDSKRKRRKPHPWSAIVIVRDNCKKYSSCHANIGNGTQLEGSTHNSNMPALVLFGQKTALAGDDLRCSSTAFFVFRIIQIALLLPTLVLLVQFDDTYSTDDNGLCAEDGTRTSTVTSETGAVTNANMSTSTRSTLAANARTLMFVYWGLSMLLVIVGVSLEVAIWRTSGIGTPTEPEKRAALRPLCCGKLVLLTALRVLSFVLGVASMVLIKDYCECSSSAEKEVRQALVERRCPHFYRLRRVMGGLVWTQGIEVIIVALIYVVFIFKIVKPRRRLQNVLSAAAAPTRISTTVSTESWWKCVCRCGCACTSIFTCCIFGGKEAVTSDFAAVAMALTDIMDDGGHLDVTLSDIVAGLRMVRRVQKEKQEALESRETTRVKEEDPVSESATMESGGVEGLGSVRMSLLVRDEGSEIFCEAAERQVLDGGDAADRQVIAEGAHFMRLSLAIYGYIMYMIEHKLTGPCLLTAISLNCKRSCCCWSKDNVVGDTSCGCNLLAMLRTAGLDEEDIEYAQFGVSVERNPYCITVDHVWKSVVLTIRGTLSLEDAVTDLSIRPASLSEWGERCSFNGEGEYCHEGMLVSAEWVLRDLEKHGVLDKLLLADNCRYPGYRLYVAGHSLGAGCAAILALMLKPKFPSLKCLCFEPPAVMSARVAEQAITSFVLDADIVPRLSYHSLENLRDDMLDLIARIRVPKYQIMAGLSKAKTFAESNAETLHKSTSIHPSTFSRQLEKFKEHQQGMYGIHAVVCVFLFCCHVVVVVAL